MADIITDGTAGATGTHVATGTTEVIASGGFGGNTVQILVNADAGDPAPAHTFMGPGAISLQTAVGTTITATVIGKNTSTVDVTANP
jgi:hypothetical protein